MLPTTSHTPNQALTRPKLLAFFDSLNRRGIAWGLYCGGASQFLTGNRQSQDIDIVISHKDFATVAAFAPPEAIIHDEPDATVTCGDGLVLDFPRRSICFDLDGSDMEIMASTTASAHGRDYDLAMTDFSADHRLMFEQGETQLYVSHPFDTMALKAILQRGAQQGKHDAEDVAALNKWCPLDTAYARRRMSEIQLDSRAIDFLNMCGVEIATTSGQTMPAYDIIYAY